MLVLSRKPEESVVINGEVVITILGVQGDRVKLGIQAPRHVTIVRRELIAQVAAANLASATERPRQLPRLSLRGRLEPLPAGPSAGPAAP
jgi:carbon storage regulator